MAGRPSSNVRDRAAIGTRFCLPSNYADLNFTRDHILDLMNFNNDFDITEDGDYERRDKFLEFLQCS
jgi:hypothetical protein